MKVGYSNIINKILNKAQKLVVVFVLIMVLFNNLVPKNFELKNNFFSALNCVVGSMEYNFLDKYVTVVNNILINLNIIKLAGTQVISTGTQKQEKDKQFPVNTSADSGIIIQNSINQIEILKANLSCLIYEMTNKLYNIYGSIKIICNKEMSNVGILFFILFSILVVRIKDTIAVLNNKIIVRNRLAY